MSKDVECPYCGHPQDINHDDGYGYQEGENHQQVCGKCDKKFVFTTQISYDYDVYQADCLNGAEHNYQPQTVIPKCHTKMECKDCGEIRNPTPEEKIQYQIPEYQY